ncbi:MAG: radical SAM protein [Archaeoglobaceae archaeon]
MELVVNPSPNVTPYCYSLLHVEPYATCQFSCVYCFARWYRGEELAANRDAVRLFERVAEKIRRRGLKPFPFRLAAFVDPFQPAESEFRLSRKVMKISLRLGIPLIVNTKAEPDELIVELASRGLAILQVSLTTLSDEKASVIEPRAPKPSERLKVVEKFSSDVPTIVRLQPLIPGLSELEIVDAAKAAGARQLVAEIVRDEEVNVSIYERLGAELGELEEYSSTAGVDRIVRPKLEVRRRVYEEFAERARKVHIDFALCKEPFFDLETAENCCGMHYLQDYALRLTLRELSRGAKSVEELDERYVFGERLRAYPRVISRGLRWHEKVLFEIYGAQNLSQT